MTARRRMAGVAASIAVMLAVSALWIIHLQNGPRLDGWTAGPTLIFVPITGFILFAVWMVVRAIGSRWIAWSLTTATIGAAILALVAIILNCGPTACFTDHASNRYLGWFVLASVAGAAAAYQAIAGASRDPAGGN